MKIKDIRADQMLQVDAHHFYITKGARRKKLVTVKIIEVRPPRVLCESINYRMGTRAWLKPADFKPMPGDDDAAPGPSLRSLAKEI